MLATLLWWCWELQKIRSNMLLPSLRGLKGYSTTVSPVRRDRQHRHEANKFTGYLATVDVARYEYGH